MHHATTIYKSSIGFIFEGNKNSLDSIAAALGISFDYTVFRRLSIGAKAFVSYDVFEDTNTVYALEPLGFLRWYVVSPTGEPGSGLFAEAQGGIELIIVNSDFNVEIDGGLSVGFRIPFGSFYAEPALRFGYPYIFGGRFGTGLPLLVSL